MQTAANIHQGKLENQEKAYEDKLKRAAAAREANLHRISQRAFTENVKVDEVSFINAMMERDKRDQLNQRLSKGEERRKKNLEEIRLKAERKAEIVKAAAAKRWQSTEERKREMKEAIDRKMEMAQKRKERLLTEQQKS